jgi:hypothetical protein
MLASVRISSSGLGLRRRRSLVDPPDMGLRNLRSDVQSKPETLTAVTNLSAKKRLEQSLHRCFCDGLAGVPYPKFELVAFRACPDTHRLVRSSMGESVAKKIRC